MRSEMGALIQRHGGVPYSAPVLQEIYLKDSPEVARLVDDICSGSVDTMVFLTGVGTNALMETAGHLGRLDEFLGALNQRTVIARSPKPARVLRQHKIHIDLMPPEPYTSQDMIEALKETDLAGKQVAVQAYGAPAGFLTKSLAQRGANVQEITLYTWGLPQDQSPVFALIDDLAQGKIEAVAFTSQPQVTNLISIAASAGKEESLRSSLASDGVAVASVGPVCTRRLQDSHINVNVQPGHPHMGNLVLALADYLEGFS